MYDSQNLPLSSLKPLKKTIARNSGCIVGVPFFLVIFGAMIWWAKASGEAGLKDFLPFTKYVIIISLAMLVIGIIYVYIYEYIYYRLYYYNFTDDGGEIRKGIIARATGHVRYERLQNIYVDQDFWDRVFGLYDVHYETAGEMSNFYSHVDGLNKDNADKLITFLNDKARGKSSQTQNVQKQSVPNEPSQNSKNPLNGSTQIELSREICPISKMLIITRSLGYLYLFGALIVFVLLFGLSKENFGTIQASIPFIIPLIIGLFALVFIIALIYEIIWFNNFRFYFKNDKGEIIIQVLGRSVSYLYYDRIQDIKIEQGVLGRIFDMHCITVETAGESSGSSFILDGFNKDNAEKIRDFLLEKAKSYKKNL